MDWEAFYNAFRSPDFIPGFEIEYRLGGGAFGDVYKARRTSIGKPYAIKFLKVEDEDHRVAVERELDQVRHFAAIDHPNLVSIEDLGLALGVPYVIMGYAGDETLAKRMRAGDLTALEALRVFTQAARGVMALHEHQLVHFDLKPSNIFLLGEQARVGDYGLSKLLDGGRMTLSYGRGTPMYMAPEILRSRADHRADLYSLGVILFESLTGRVPYAPEEIGGLVLRDTDEPPHFPPEFPAAARRVCEACLRLDPADRVQSAEEVLELLGQSARPGDEVEFDLAPEAAARKAPAPPRSGATPTALARPLGGAALEGAAPMGTASPSNGPKGLGGAALIDASSRLMEGGVRVDPLGGDWQGTAADGAAPRASSGTPGAQAMALVAELRARREADARQGVPTVPRVDVVPVPPMVTGGLGSTLFETTRVAFDVFVASIVGVVSSIVLAFRWVSDRLVRRTGGGFVARAARFALFLLLMATVGFGATLLGLVGLFLSSAAR